MYKKNLNIIQLNVMVCAGKNSPFPINYASWIALGYSYVLCPYP